MFKSLIADILNNSRMTQTELAVLIGISQASVSDLYRGRVTDPRASIADKLRQIHAERCGTRKAA